MEQKPRPASPESNYGSDFSLGEEDIVNGLLDAATAQSSTLAHQLGAAAAAADRGLPSAAPGFGDSLDGLPVLVAPAGHSSRPPVAPGSLGVVGQTTVSSRRSLAATRAAAQEDDQPPPPAPGEQDTRSPLTRFRARRALTVTDLSSGAWCELQHWYTLTRSPRGRKTRTPAMKSGSRVHRALEVEVHRTVRVEVAAAEEAFALRLWNVVQGLRTLRETGMTRELEVWGTIGGSGDGEAPHVVSGVIDMLSYAEPGAEGSHKFQSQPPPPPPPPADQASIADYFAPDGDSKPRRHDKEIHLTDVKTRGSPRLPSGAMLRPAQIQLMLYHRLLGGMAASCSQDSSSLAPSETLDWPTILSFYRLDPDAPFSDTFMAKLAGLYEDDMFSSDGESASEPADDASAPTAPSSKPHLPPLSIPQDTLPYRTISDILTLLRSEIAETFPRGRASLASTLTIEYRRRRQQQESKRHKNGESDVEEEEDPRDRILGHRAFPASALELDSYMGWNMQWWRGRRQAEGVGNIEEVAYKCRSCEFANDCEWLRAKESAHLQALRKTPQAGAAAQAP